MPARDQVMSYTGAIRELGNSRPEPLLVSAEGERGLPYESIVECYAVWQLRQNARREVERLITSNMDLTLSVRDPLGWLYRSRADYRSITAAAWQRFRNGSITVAKAWPDPRRPGRPLQRYFSLPHTSIVGLLESRLIRLAF